MFNHTSTKWAPWYIVPADNKWFTRLAVGAVIYHTLRNALNLAYPSVSEQQKQALSRRSDELESEDGGKEIGPSRRRKPRPLRQPGSQIPVIHLKPKSLVSRRRNRAREGQEEKQVGI